METKRKGEKLGKILGKRSCKYLFKCPNWPKIKIRIACNWCVNNEQVLKNFDLQKNCGSHWNIEGIPHCLVIHVMEYPFTKYDFQ